MTRKLVSALAALALAGCGGGEPAAAPPDSTAASPAAGPTLTPAPAAPARYVAQGNEPFWRVEAAEGELVYASPEVPDGRAYAATASQVEGWTRFEARMDGAPLVLEVREGECLDSMSGFAFSQQARLTRSDGVWAGCARLASEPQPRE